MNAAQQELFDLAILRVLDANRSRFGLGVEAVRHLMSPYGFSSPPPDLVLDRIDYLTARGLLEEVAKAIDRANRAWRITEPGMNHVDQRG